MQMAAAAASAAGAGAGASTATYDMHPQWFKIAMDIADHKPTDPPVTTLWPQLKGKTHVHFTALGVMTTTHTDSKTGVQTSRTHVAHMRSRAPYTPALIHFIMEHIDWKTQVRNEKCNTDWYHFMECVGWQSTGSVRLTVHHFTPLPEDEEPNSTDLPIVMKLWEPKAPPRQTAATSQNRAESPDRKAPRGRSRSRSPRRHDEVPAAAAAASATPTQKIGHAALRAQFFGALAQLVDAPFEGTSVTDGGCKQEFTTLADACLSAIKARDWTPLTSYKSTVCPAWIQDRIDSLFASLKNIPKESWIHTYLFQGAVERLICYSCSNPSLQEVAVWLPVLIRIAALHKTRDADAKYAFSDPWMMAEREMKHVFYNVTVHTPNDALRRRAYRTVVSALYWLGCSYVREAHQAVNEFGEEVEPVEHGYCGFKQCGRRILEYKSEEYGFCNNRHLKPDWWITPAPSSTKHKPQYRCWEHGTPKFLAIEIMKFYALKRAKESGADAAAPAAAAAAAAP